MKYIPGNSKFLYSAFNNYTNVDIVNFLEKYGVQTKTERGGRIFPVSDSSQDVLKAFLKRLQELNVKIITNCKIVKILTQNNKVKGVQTEEGKEILAEKVILATGGITYSVTGSTGDGYNMAKSLGHTIKSLKPALVPLTCSNQSLTICKEAQGLSLKNVAIKVIADNKLIYQDFGEMLFTHFGVSGPIVLSASSILQKYKNIEEIANRFKTSIR